MECEAAGDADVISGHPTLTTPTWPHHCCISLEPVPPLPPYTCAAGINSHSFN